MTSLWRPAAWLLAQGGVLLYLWAPSLLPGRTPGPLGGVEAWAPLVVPPLLYALVVLCVPHSSALRRLAATVVLLGLHAGLGFATAAVYGAARLGPAPGPLDPTPWAFPLVPVMQLLSVPLVALPLRMFLVRPDNGDSAERPVAPASVTATPTPVRRERGWDETDLHTVGGERFREDDAPPPGLPNRRLIRREPTRPFSLPAEPAAGSLRTETPPRTTWPPRTPGPAPLDMTPPREAEVATPPVPASLLLPRTPLPSEVTPVPRVEPTFPGAPVDVPRIDAPFAPSAKRDLPLPAPVEPSPGPPEVIGWPAAPARTAAPPPSIDDDVLAITVEPPPAVVVPVVTVPPPSAEDILPVSTTRPVVDAARVNAPVQAEVEAPVEPAPRIEAVPRIETPWVEPAPRIESAARIEPAVAADSAAAASTAVFAEHIARALAGAGPLVVDTHALMGIVVYTACSLRLAEDAVVRAAFRFLSFLAESPGGEAVTQTTVRGAAGAMVLTPLGPLGAGGPVLAAAIPQRGALALLEILSLRVAAEYRASEPGSTSPAAGSTPATSPAGLGEAPLPPRVEGLARSLTACGPLRPLGLTDQTGKLLLYVLAGPGVDAHGVGRFAADLYRVMEIDGDPGGVGPFQSVVVRLGDQRVVVRPVAEAPGHSTVLVAAGPASDRPGLVQLQIERAAARLAAPPG
jgi:hypothetical protein